MLTAAPAVFAQNQKGGPPVPVHSTVKNNLHQQELQNQRERLKGSRRSVHAEARGAGRHDLVRKYGRHQMKKIQHHPSLHSANLRLARRENKAHRKARQKPRAN